MTLPAVRTAIAEHARAELPNEACGLLLLDGEVAVDYVPGENASPSPYVFELRLDPVGRHRRPRPRAGGRPLSCLVGARPSRTDVERIGLWRDRPYLIYSVRLDELAAWRIRDGSIEPIAVTERYETSR